MGSLFSKINSNSAAKQSPATQPPEQQPQVKDEPVVQTKDVVTEKVESTIGSSGDAKKTDAGDAIKPVEVGTEATAAEVKVDEQQTTATSAAVDESTFESLPAAKELLEVQQEIEAASAVPDINKSPDSEPTSADNVKTNDAEPADKIVDVVKPSCEMTQAPEDPAQCSQMDQTPAEDRSSKPACCVPDASDEAAMTWDDKEEKSEHHEEEQQQQPDTAADLVVLQDDDLSKKLEELNLAVSSDDQQPQQPEMTSSELSAGECRVVEQDAVVASPCEEEPKVDFDAPVSDAVDRRQDIEG